MPLTTSIAACMARRRSSSPDSSDQYAACGREHGVRCRKQRMVTFDRLVFEYVNARAPQLAGIERLGERYRVDNGSAAVFTTMASGFIREIACASSMWRVSA